MAMIAGVSSANSEPQGVVISANVCIRTTLAFKEVQEMSETERMNGLSRFITFLPNHVDLKQLTKNVIVYGKSPSGDVVATLEMDFYENKIVTQYKGVEKTLALSSALGTLRDLAVVFIKVQQERVASERLLTIVDHITAESDSQRNSKPDETLTVQGEELLSFSPSRQRIILDPKGQAKSLPQRAVMDCSHFFNQDYALSICTALGTEPGMFQLIQNINDVYVGRCLLGLAKSKLRGVFASDVYERELARIVQAAVRPGSVFMTRPLS